MQKLLLALVALTLIGIIAGRADAREWKSKTGNFKVEARLIESTNENVRLKTADGREISVSLESLGKADREYAAAWLRAKSGASPELPEHAALLMNVKIKSPQGRTMIMPNIAGFAISWPDQKRAVALSVVHPFTNPVDGIDLANMEKTVTGGDLIDPQTRKAFGKLSGTLQLRGIKKQEGNDTAHDITAFWVDAASKVGALPLASESPLKDEKVWLIGLPEWTDTAVGKKPEVIPAKVVETEKDHITFELDGAVVPPNCIGAPIVNFAGEVVGMFSFRGGRKGTVVAVRPEDIRSKLTKAI